MLTNLHFSYSVQNRSGIVKFTYLFMNTKRTQLHNIITCSKDKNTLMLNFNFLACSKAEIYRVHAPTIETSHTLH